MTTRVGINGFGRVGRQSLKALIERAPGHRGRRHQRPGARRARRAPVQARLHVWNVPGRRRPHSDDLLIVDGRQIRVFQEKGPRQPAVGRPRRRHRAGEHRLFTTPRRPGRTSTPAPRRSSSAPRPRARTSRSSSASTTTRTTRPRITSSATPRARRTAWLRWPRSSTTCRHREGPDEHDPRLHERPAHPRRRAQGPAPRPRAPARTSSRRRPARPRRSALVIPDLKGKSTASACACRRRPCQRRRLHRHGQPRRPASRSSTPRSGRRRDGPLKGILGVTDEPLVSMDFKGDAALVDHRRGLDHGPRRQHGEGHRLVRQRVGLQCRVADLVALVGARLPVAA